MYRIETLNKISPIGLEQFDASKYTCGSDMENPDAILVRSASMHEMEFGSQLLCIARAGAGVNNIPVDKCAEDGIVVFNTPGANANAVKELVVLGLLLSSRKVPAALEWAKTLAGQEGVAKLVEKGKGQFVGPEIRGKKLGVIGLGAIGVLVSNAAKSLGMEVYGYDPYMSVDAAWALSRGIHKAVSMQEIYENCDYITVHVPFTDDTKEMINADVISTCKEGVRFLNFSRAGLVNDDDMIAALKSGKVSCYVTDFPNEKTVNAEGVIAIPHLGASTPESEDNCAEMAAQEVISFLENGNILNSVNFPTVEMPRSGKARICVIHKNIPNMLSKIAAAVSEKNVNIDNMLNRSRGNNAYTILDTEVETIDSTIVDTISVIDGVIRVRVV